MTRQITVAMKDKNYEIPFKVRNDDDTAFDLSGCSVAFKVWQPGLPDTLIVNSDCTIDTPEDGACHYNVQDGDFNKRQELYAELEMTKSTMVISTEYFTIQVIESG